MIRPSRWICGLLVCLVAAASVRAQDSDSTPPLPASEPTASNADPAFPMLQRWMRRMAKEHPEDFQALMEARERDPAEFQRMLRSRRDRLRTRRFLSGMGELPRFRDYVQSLSPEEREQLNERILQFLARQGISPDRTLDDPEKKRWEAEAQELARRYHQAPPEEREAIKVQLRSRLTQAFDEAESARRRQIIKIEARLEELKRVLAQREADRDQIIDRRLLELTDGDPLAW
jgi:hypothetical protein